MSDNTTVHGQKNDDNLSPFGVIVVGIVGILFLFAALWATTSNIMGIINNKIAISNGYTYAAFMHEQYSSLNFMISIMSIMFFLCYIFFILVTVFAWIKREKLSNCIKMTGLCFIPVCFFIYNYQNTDEYMYEPINNLYEKLVFTNPNFAKSDIGLQFSKALTTHDYASLKKITNDMDSLKTMDFKWNKKIGEVINLLPLPKSVEAFKAMTSDNTRFISVADYQLFYDNLLSEFKASDISSKKEFIYLVDSIHPDRYYSQLP